MSCNLQVHHVFTLFHFPFVWLNLRQSLNTVHQDFDSSYLRRPTIVFKGLEDGHRHTYVRTVSMCQQGTKADPRTVDAETISELHDGQVL